MNLIKTSLTQRFPNAQKPLTRKSAGHYALHGLISWFYLSVVLNHDIGELGRIALGLDRKLGSCLAGYFAIDF